MFGGTFRDACIELGLRIESGAMNLVGLSFHNYKAFGGRESLEIRPLTVLIGKNSSGKSAVARLPLLLAGAFDDQADAPIPLVVPGIDFGASFLDLIHNRRPHGTLELGAKVEVAKGFCEEIHVKIQYYHDVKVQVIQELIVDTPDGRYTLVRLGQDPTEEQALYRLDMPDDKTAEIRPRFRGLRVNATSPFARDYKDLDLLRVLSSFDSLLRMAAQDLSNVGYLGPFRDIPQRQYRSPGGLPQNVGRNGSHAPQLLAADAAQKQGVVVKAVGEWYRQFLGGWSLDVVPLGDMFSLVLRSPSDPNVMVNLVDAGTGLSQVLPLVVQRQFEEVTKKGSGGLEVVEQPELHLHPGAHGNLADLYIEAIKQGSRFLIETHSENFILRIRRRIAEGLDPSLVRIYSVEEDPRSGSTIKAINVQQNGEVDYWPKGVFSEDFDEVCAIREAQGAGEL